MTVRILAIDPGSCCGYSVMDVSQPVPHGLQAQRAQSGTWDLHQKKCEDDAMRYLRLKKFLMELNPDFIGFELVNFPHRSTQAAACYWGIVAVIKLYCKENEVMFVGVETGSLKRRATGKGGGKGTKKPEMVQAANKAFNIIPPLDDTDSASNKDHNIADAMWLMQIALEEYASVIKKKGTKDA